MFALVSDPRLRWLGFLTLMVLGAVTAQLVFVAIRREYGNPWWRLAAVFALLTLIVASEVWRGFPAAITRVALPLTFGFNVLLASRERRFWHWYLLGNVHLVPAYFILF
jgi:hypothetical protein